MTVRSRAGIWRLAVSRCTDCGDVNLNITGWRFVGGSSLCPGCLEKELALLVSARKEADEVLGLLMYAPGFACGGVTASTVVYTRNGRAFRAVIHDVTESYTATARSGWLDEDVLPEDRRDSTTATTKET